MIFAFVSCIIVFVLKLSFLRVFAGVVFTFIPAEFVSDAGGDDLQLFVVYRLVCRLYDWLVFFHGRQSKGDVSLAYK